MRHARKHFEARPACHGMQTGSERSWPLAGRFSVTICHSSPMTHGSSGQVREWLSDPLDFPSRPPATMTGSHGYRDVSSLASKELASRLKIRGLQFHIRHMAALIPYFKMGGRHEARCSLVPAFRSSAPQMPACCPRAGGTMKPGSPDMVK